MNKKFLERLNNAKIPCDAVSTNWLTERQITLNILRTDLLDPLVSGNKWYKQKGHLEYAFANSYTIALSFGGAWSNHIHALAASGYGIGFPTIGVIRGERSETLSATLKDAEAMGMRLHFVSRSDYRLKNTTEFRKQLLADLGLSADEVWIVPEGGSGELGVIGCEDILPAGDINPEDYRQIWLASGTGATTAGVIRSVPDTVLVRSVAVLKGASWMVGEIAQYLPEGRGGWQVETDAHCGGYAKTTPELLAFIEQFSAEAGIPLDQVYTGKMMFALYSAVMSGEIAEGSRLLAIHTGGLQGRRGLKSVAENLA